MPVVIEQDPEYGPARCVLCAAPIVVAISDSGHLELVDAEPCAGGELEIFTEYFPDGSQVDGAVRVRMRPADRPSSSPAWRPHVDTCSSLLRNLADDLERRRRGIR